MTVDAWLTLVVIVGFVGVLCIIQPRSDGFDGYALVCLASTVLLSVRDLATRRVHAAVPSILVTLSNTIAVTTFAALLLMAVLTGAVALRRIGRVVAP